MLFRAFAAPVFAVVFADSTSLFKNPLLLGFSVGLVWVRPPKSAPDALTLPDQLCSMADAGLAEAWLEW